MSQMIQVATTNALLLRAADQVYVPCMPLLHEHVTTSPHVFASASWSCRTYRTSVLKGALHIFNGARLQPFSLQLTIVKTKTVIVMPHATDAQYQHIQATPLAPTIGAEVTGIDFSKPVEPEIFAEVKDAITKVSKWLEVSFQI